MTIEVLADEIFSRAKAFVFESGEAIEDFDTLPIRTELNLKPTDNPDGFMIDALEDLCRAADFSEDPQSAYDRWVLDYEANGPMFVGTGLGEYWQNFFEDQALRTIRRMVEHYTHE